MLRSLIARLALAVSLHAEKELRHSADAPAVKLFKTGSTTTNCSDYVAAAKSIPRGAGYGSATGVGGD
ncbi:MAG: hypothetical protein U1F27_03085 [Turneriella sp.]